MKTNLDIMCEFMGQQGGSVHSIAADFTKLDSSDILNPVELDTKGVDHLYGFSLWNESVKERVRFAMYYKEPARLVSALIKAYRIKESMK